LARRRLFYFFLAEEDYFTGSTLMAQPTSPSDQRPEQMPTLCFSAIPILHPGWSGTPRHTPPRGVGRPISADLVGYFFIIFSFFFFCCFSFLLFSVFFFPFSFQLIFSFSFCNIFKMFRSDFFCSNFEMHSNYDFFKKIRNFVQILKFV
jgi:hypothetical protein